MDRQDHVAGQVGETRILPSTEGSGVTPAGAVTRRSGTDRRQVAFSGLRSQLLADRPEHASVWDLEPEQSRGIATENQVDLILG